MEMEEENAERERELRGKNRERTEQREGREQ